MVGIDDVLWRSFVLRYLWNNKKPVWNKENNLRVCSTESSRMAFNYFCVESNNGLLMILREALNEAFKELFKN